MADRLDTGPGIAMSFRTRLTSFFVVIVILPMLAVGVLVFALIGQSQQGKADARANGLASAAASIYASASATARADATAIARAIAIVPPSRVAARAGQLAATAGLARVKVSERGRTLLELGSPATVAPGVATASRAAGPPITVTVTQLTAADYARELVSGGTGVVVRQDGSTLTAAPPAAARAHLPLRGSVSIGGQVYRALTQSFKGFGASPVRVTVLSSLAATASSVSTDRLLAAVFIAAFLLLAFSFSVLSSRALQGQLARFLQAARRLAAGDFSSPVPTEGRDEFAALGEEFNRMSEQLAQRIEDVAEERARLREAIRRTGHTFAANLDRPALVELSLRTALDAVEGEAGRLSVRIDAGSSLEEASRLGELAGLEQLVLEAEREALYVSRLREVDRDGAAVAAVPLGMIEGADLARGLITVARQGEPFSDDDRDVLRFLAAQTTLALDNVDLHFQVRRQAVTDELTGLANHGRFQELLAHESEQVRRYHHSLGLIMLDIDNFKQVNDTYGHQQGDVVLRRVARVLRDTSREVDVPARYGGEEMALILPHTDLEGSYAIAERLREEIQTLRVPRLDGSGVLRVTASIGVAASLDGDKDALIAEADAALYAAKREGKNRSVRAASRAANVIGAE